MKDFDSKKLDALLATGDLKGAEAYIRAIFSGPENPNARVDAAIDYALAYAKISNVIQADYLASLNQTIELLHKTKLAEGRVSDTVRLAQVKADLGLK